MESPFTNIKITIQKNYKTVNIQQNLEKIKQNLPKHVELVAISKTKSEVAIMEAYNAGQRIFGENRTEELEKKHETLPKDIQWHMVGHLQRRKVRDIAAFVDMIHAVDSPRLLREINQRAKANDRIIDCLLQMKIAEEDTKYGMDATQIQDLIQSEEYATYENVRVRGLMAMATFTEDKDKLNREFKGIHNLYQELKEKQAFDTLSIGMSGDYPIAIENGSTMVRVGSAIFGERE